MHGMERLLAFITEILCPKVKKLLVSILMRRSVSSMNGLKFGIWWKCDAGEVLLEVEMCLSGGFGTSNSGYLGL